jgi:hypothetical protein
MGTGVLFSSRFSKLFIVTGIFLLFLWYMSRPTNLIVETRRNVILPDLPTMHLVTGLLFNRKHAWNAGENRASEEGMWLLSPLLNGINKTVYDSDVFLTDDEVMSSVALDRFSEKTWQEFILKALTNRSDIDLRPIAQHKKSQECPYYLTYIIDHYRNLPDIILFTHGHPQTHNPNILEHWSWFVRKVQQDTHGRFFDASVGFLHANCGIYVQRHTKSRPILDLLGYNRTVGPLANQIQTLALSTYCCAQFIVHRSRILEHPLSFWRLALKIAIDMNDCSHFEHLWHVIFGESNELDQRKSLAKWYEAENPNQEQCPTRVVH